MTTETIPQKIYRKLSFDLIDKLTGYIAEGNYAVTSCALAGISKDAYYEWLRQAQDDNQNGNEELLKYLITSIEKAEAQAETDMIAIVRASAKHDKNWLAAMTFLERRHPERWGRKDRLQVDKREVKEVTIIVEHYPEGFTPPKVKEIINAEVKEIE